jgi:hypothetical protein
MKEEGKREDADAEGRRDDDAFLDRVELFRINDEVDRMHVKERNILQEEKRRLCG